MNRKVPMLGAIVALFLFPALIISIVGFSLPEQGDAPFKRFANSLLTSYSVVTLFLIANMVFYADSRHKPLSPIVGMLLSLSAGFIVAYLIFSSGEIMYEQNSSIRAQIFSNIVRLVVTLASVLSEGLIVVGVGFSFMMNKDGTDNTDSNQE